MPTRSHPSAGTAGQAASSCQIVRRELARQEMGWAARRPMGLTGLPAAALALRPARRLAWLLGRQTVEGLEPAGAWR